MTMQPANRILKGLQHDETDSASGVELVVVDAAVPPHMESFMRVMICPSMMGKQKQERQHEGWQQPRLQQAQTESRQRPVGMLCGLLLLMLLLLLVWVGFCTDTAG